jgi:hypothetical protein
MFNLPEDRIGVAQVDRFIPAPPEPEISFAVSRIRLYRRFCASVATFFLIHPFNRHITEAKRVRNVYEVFGGNIATFNFVHFYHFSVRDISITGVQLSL